jgi:hypothetical protein
MPDGSELWWASVAEPIDQFDVEYQVVGQIYWDNNSGHDYVLDVGAAEGVDGTGTLVMSPKIMVAGPYVDGTGVIKVPIWVQNLAYQKQVGIVYSTDNWRTYQTALGAFQQGYAPNFAPHQPSVELWEASAPVGLNNPGQLAAFYNVQASVFWDNNFRANYTFQ